MKLNMYLCDWIIVPIWCSIFALGMKTGMIIMFPVMLVFALLNVLYSKSTFTLILVDMNLMMASVAGIIVNSLLFTRFIYADRENVSSMMVGIFVSILYLTLIMIFSMTVKDMKRRNRRRIINRLANEDDEEDDDDDGYDYDDDEDDEDYLSDDEDDMSIERRMASRLLHKDNEGDDEDEEDEEDDSPQKREPKFKVIKKK